VTTTEPASVVLPPIELGVPAQLDLTVYRGDTGVLRVLVLQDGAPLDVSAATWDCDVRATAEGALMSSFDVTPVAGQTNAVDVALSAASSAALLPGDAVWDLEMTLGTDPDQTVTTLLRGDVTIVADVSRAPFEPPPVGPAAKSAGAPVGAGPLGVPVGGAVPTTDPGPLVVHGIEDSGHVFPEVQP
jgi:hypothetical protein